jgi:hypothetical protein
MSEANGTETWWVIVAQLTALPAWLALPRDQRQSIADRVAGEVRQHSDVQVRWLDAEAFTAECSDVLLAETADLAAWYHLFEMLRDMELFTMPYFRLERIVTGIEDGYRAHDKMLEAR